MRLVDARSFKPWIIGYGNSQRRDDGIGPYVVGRLKKILKQQEGIAFRSLHQLEPELVEELQYATFIVFVDATVEELEGGWQWIEVEPNLREIPYLTHHCKPSYLLGLLRSLYHRCPKTWVVSVQADDLGFGGGLSPEAQSRAHKVVSALVNFAQGKMIDKHTMRHL